MSYDAVVIGSAIRLAAAITLAQAGLAVLVVESKATPGGGMRTQELHAAGLSPRHLFGDPPTGAGVTLLSQPAPGRRWPGVDPPPRLAGAPAGWRHGGGGDSFAGRNGRPIWGRIDERRGDGCLRRWSPTGRPLSTICWRRFTFHVTPCSLAHMRQLLAAPATWLAKTLFHGERARAVIAGMAGHSVLPLERPPTGAFGLLLTMLAQSVGWPVARGGSQAIADALVRHLQRLGGNLVCGWEVTDLADLPPARAYSSTLRRAVAHRRAVPAA